VEEETNWPEWLQPFAPLIMQWADKLLGNSPQAVGLRQLVKQSDTFKKNWCNLKKREEATKVLNKTIGEEVTSGLIKFFNGESEG
jgi:hypothetical protein